MGQKPIMGQNPFDPSWGSVRQVAPHQLPNMSHVGMALGPGNPSPVE
jgi:hypothetical protein